jgi:hypothetical protein
MKPLETIIAGHLNKLVGIAVSNGIWTAGHSVGDVVEAMAAETYVQPVAFANLAGTILRRALAISPPGGSKNRISVAIRSLEPYAPVFFVVGCKKVTGEELALLSEQKHGKGTAENKHYIRFRETGETLLAWPDKLADLADVVRETIESIHYRRTARADQLTARL